MLSHAKEHESLTGKLLLSTALVAVTVGYGWWQHGQAEKQQAAMMAAMQAQMLAAANVPAPAAPPAVTQAQSAAPPAAATVDAATPAPADAAAPAAAAPDNSKLAMASPAPAPVKQAAAPAAAAPANGGLLPADPPKPAPPPLTGMAAIQNFLPTEGISPPLPPVSGTPDASANPPIPAGTHLEDGDYTSDKIQFEWGDLRSRIVVTGGKITTVQIMSYPDHRSQSLYLIQLADPILTTEVIKSQQAKVNTVSTATNSSIAFQDSIANAIVKATR